MLSVASEHCVKSVRIRSFTGSYFPAFELNEDKYSVSLHIQFECGKIRTRKTPNTNTFHVMGFIAQNAPAQSRFFYQYYFDFCQPNRLIWKKTRSRSTCLVGLGQVCPFSLRVLQKWPKIKVPKSTIMLCKPQI